MGLFLSFIGVGLFLCLFVNGISFADIKKTIGEAKEAPGALLGVLVVIAVVSILLSLFVSWCYQGYLATDHERFENAFEYPLANLGSSDDTATYMLGRASTPNNSAYVKFKYYDENNAVHSQQSFLSDISIVVHPNEKPRYIKSIRWITDVPNFWIWDFRWGSEYTLVVPNTSGVESEVLREILVKE